MYGQMYLLICLAKGPLVPTNWKIWTVLPVLRLVCPCQGLFGTERFIYLFTYLRMPTGRTSEEVWGTNALKDAITAYQNTKLGKCNLEVINKLHALCLVMVDKIMNLEATNVATLIEKTQAEKNVNEMKDQKKEKDAWNKVKEETKGRTLHASRHGQWHGQWARWISLTIYQ